MFGSINLSKNVDPNIYKYGGYSKFYSCSEFSLVNNDMGNNIIIFGFYMSLSVHFDHKEKIS